MAIKDIQYDDNFKCGYDEALKVHSAFVAVAGQLHAIRMSCNKKLGEMLENIEIGKTLGGNALTYYGQIVDCTGNMAASIVALDQIYNCIKMVAANNGDEQTFSGMIDANVKIDDVSEEFKLGNTMDKAQVQKMIEIISDAPFILNAREAATSVRGLDTAAGLTKVPEDVTYNFNEIAKLLETTAEQVSITLEALKKSIEDINAEAKARLANANANTGVVNQSMNTDSRAGKIKSTING